MQNQNAAGLRHYPLSVLENQLKMSCYDIKFSIYHFFSACKAIVSPDKLHPKYITSEYCLIFTSPCLMSISFMFFNLWVVPKTIDFVLSSPKCILSLLSTNQSHNVLKSSLSLFSISYNVFPSKKETQVICV